MIAIVDYDRSVDNGIEAGGYVNPRGDYITEEVFPPSEEESGKKQKFFTFYHFNRRMDTDDVVDVMRNWDERPATLRELLAFGETHPECQQHFDIVALGSIGFIPAVRIGSYRAVPALTCENRGRCILPVGTLASTSHRWPAGVRFLAVDK